MIDKIFNNPDAKPSSEIQDGKIKYEFSTGITAHQEELLVEEGEQLLKVLGEVSFEDVTIAGFISHLLSANVMGKLLSVILKTKDKKEVDFGKLKASELWSVINDFFILNPLVRNLLESSAKELVSKSSIPTI